MKTGGKGGNKKERKNRYLSVAVIQKTKDLKALSVGLDSQFLSDYWIGFFFWIGSAFLSDWFWFFLRIGSVFSFGLVRFISSVWIYQKYTEGSQ